jgi:ubiquinone/menaquinone biosynthesis C-methylase UbiE
MQKRGVLYSEIDDFKHHEKEFEEFIKACSYRGISLLPEMITLDVGAGQGMHAGFLANICRKVYCCDVINYSSLYDGEFYKLLAEKYERNGYNLPLEKLLFIDCDCMNLFFKDNLFDFTVSFNTFEHIADPLKALREIVRVTKPGGYIYITFDPVWTADSGSHFTHRIKDPWAHLLLTEEDFIAEMIKFGSDSYEIQELRTALNKIPPEKYQEFFYTVIDENRLEVIEDVSWSGVSKEENYNHPNFRLLLNKGYKQEQLLLRGMRFILRKNEH